MPVEDIGARLVLAGRAEFVSDMDLASASVDEFTVTVGRADAAMEALEARMGSVRDVAAESATASGASADALVAASAASAERAEAAEREARAVQAANAASKDSASVLETLAGSSVIKGTALFGTGALLAGAYETVKQYTSFNALVTQSAVDAGIPAKDLGQVQKQLIADSDAYGVKVNDLANSWYRVASAMSGGHATLKQMLSLTKDAAKLDVLFNVPAGNQTEQLSRIMGALMRAHLRGAQTPDQIMALANAAVGRGDIRGADLISALGKSLAPAMETGESAVDLTAWIDTLTKLGMQGSQAGTLISHSVQQLAKPTEQGEKAEQMLGIDPNGPNSLSELIRHKGIGYTVDYLTSKMRKFDPTSYYPKFSTNAPGRASALGQLEAWGVTDPTTQQAFLSGKMTKDQTLEIQQTFLSKIFGGAKSASPMLALTSDEGAYNSLVESILKGSTPQALQRSLEIAMNTPERQMKIAEANISNASMTIGKSLTPDVVAGAHALADVAKYLADHTDVLKGLLAALAAFVGVAVGIETVSKISKVATDLGKIGKTIFGIGGSAGSSTAKTAAAADTMMTAADTMMAAADRMSIGGAAGAVEGGELAVGAGELSAAESSGLATSIRGVLSKAIAGIAGGAIAGFITYEIAKRIAGKNPSSVAQGNVDAVTGLVTGAYLGGSVAGPEGAVVGGAVGAVGGLVYNLYQEWHAGDMMKADLQNKNWDRTHKSQFIADMNDAYRAWSDDGVPLNGMGVGKWQENLYAKNVPQKPTENLGGLLRAISNPTLVKKANEDYDISSGAKDLLAAAQEHSKAAKDLQKASVEYGPGAAKLERSAKALQDAAQKHQDAANRLAAAAAALENVNVTITQAQIGQAANSYNANIKGRT